MKELIPSCMSQYIKLVDTNMSLKLSIVVQF